MFTDVRLHLRGNFIPFHCIIYVFLPYPFMPAIKAAPIPDNSSIWEMATSHPAISLWNCMRYLFFVGPPSAFNTSSFLCESIFIKYNISEYTLFQQKIKYFLLYFHFIIYLFMIYTCKKSFFLLNYIKHALRKSQCPECVASPVMKMESGEAFS